MQQSVGCLVVGFGATSYRRRSLAPLTGFAAWMPQYPGLVQELTVTNSQPPSSSETLAAAEQLLAFALQLCVAQPSAKPALQLKSFTTNFIFSAAALRSLAACRDLEKLTFYAVEPQQHLTPAFCAALAQLTTVTTLQLCSQATGVSYPTCLAPAMRHLSQLQLLYAHNDMPAAGLVDLPPSLTELYLSVDIPAPGPATDQPGVVDLRHLTRLQRLQLTVPDTTPVHAQLPAAVTSLYTTGCIVAMPGVQQLQQLFVQKARLGLPLLQQAQALRKLGKVRVGLHGYTTRQLRATVAAIGVLTRLTGLQLFGKHGCEDSYWSDNHRVDVSAVQVHASP